MDIVTLGVVGYVLGNVLNIVVPYVIERLDNPNLSFDWRHLVAKILGGAVPVLAIITQPSFIQTLRDTGSSYQGYTWLYFISIVVMGLGASQIGRQAHKLQSKLSKK